MSSTKLLNTMAERSSSFGIYQQAGYNLIKATGGLSPTDCTLLEAEIAATEQANPQHFIIDFGALDRAGANCVQMIAHVHHLLAGQAGARQLRVINICPELMTTLRAAGLPSQIAICGTLLDAYAELGILREGGLDVNIVVPFINAVADAVEKIIHVSTVKLPSLKQPVTSTLPGEVSGLIALTGPTFSGTVIVSFPKDTILKMITKLTGEQQSELNSLVKSAVGEFANIASMSAKKHLNEIGYGLRCSIPSVVSDPQLPADYARGLRKSVVVPLDTELGKYFIDIRF